MLHVIQLRIINFDFYFSDRFDWFIGV